MPDNTMTPMPDMNIPAQGINDASMGIMQKMSQKPPDQNFDSKAVNLLTGAIRSLNAYADMVVVTDEANARAARLIIGVLGELLKTAQYEQKSEENLEDTEVTGM